MNTKDAILEIRGDMKLVLAFVAAQTQADLPKRMTNAEDEIDQVKSALQSEQAWRKGLAASGAILGMVLIILQITNMVTVAATP